MSQVDIVQVEGTNFHGRRITSVQIQTINRLRFYHQHHRTGNNSFKIKKNSNVHYLLLLINLFPYYKFRVCYNTETITLLSKKHFNFFNGIE